MILPPKPRLVRHSREHYCRDYGQYMVIQLLSLIECLVALCSFGFVVWELRAYALFELFEDDA